MGASRGAVAFVPSPWPASLPLAALVSKDLRGKKHCGSAAPPQNGGSSVKQCKASRHPRLAECDVFCPAQEVVNDTSPMWCGEGFSLSPLVFRWVLEDTFAELRTHRQSTGCSREAEGGTTSEPSRSCRAQAVDGPESHGLRIVQVRVTRRLAKWYPLAGEEWTCVSTLGESLVRIREHAFVGGRSGGTMVATGWPSGLHSHQRRHATIGSHTSVTDRFVAHDVAIQVWRVTLRRAAQVAHGNPVPCRRREAFAQVPCPLSARDATIEQRTSDTLRRHWRGAECPCEARTLE